MSLNVLMPLSPSSPLSSSHLESRKEKKIPSSLYFGGTAPADFPDRRAQAASHRAHGGRSADEARAVLCAAGVRRGPVRAHPRQCATRRRSGGGGLLA